jgi:RNA polymerase sigma-32 factor
MQIRVDNHLTRFLSEARKFPILTAEQERDLVSRWREEADDSALEMLVGSHLRLVIKMAFRNRGYGLPLADLIAEGSTGLMHAVERFDPARGVRFATYAQWWIRAAIREHIIRSASLVRMGTTAAQRKLFFNLRRMKGALDAYEDGELSPDTVSAIAAQLDVPADTVIEMNRRLSARDQSLDMPIGANDDLTHLDLLASEEADQEAELMAADEFRKRWDIVQSAMASLTDRERHIVTERILTEPAKTLGELAQVYDISRERIRQIEANALKKLRKAAKAKSGIGYSASAATPLPEAA